MPSDALLHQIGLNVDRIISCDLLSYGAIGPLFERAEARQGGPLSLKAARLLREALSEGGTLLLTTGLILPGQYPHGETDGPLGTAVLARAVAFGLGRPVAVCCEEELMPLMAALVRRAGLQVVPAQDLVASAGRRPAAAMLPLARSEEEAARDCRRWLEEYDLRALVSIERNGRNAAGRYCMVTGTDLSDTVGKGAALFEVFQEKGLTTLGIGDRGNELGFGGVSDIVASILPKGAVAADATPSSLALPATVSNWGCYGVAACLAALLDLPELLHDARLEHALAETALANGGIDGMSGRAELSVDGVGVEVNAAVATLLGEAWRAHVGRNPSPLSTPLIR